MHEDTVLMKKKWYNVSCKFDNNAQCDGKNLFIWHDNNVDITDIMILMCCVQHSGNTVDKLQFAREETKLTMTLSDEIINVLKKIL